MDDIRILSHVDTIILSNEIIRLCRAGFKLAGPVSTTQDSHGRITYTATMVYEREVVGGKQ